MLHIQFMTNSAAAPQAPPKHFTDEELKQQYGIHLATRLQADADGKEAKWADIDDDEDDWAPDTIEWNDGTKITLPHNDPAAPLAEEQAAAAVQKARQEDQNLSRMPLPKATTSVGPNAKVLKLGTSGQPKQTTAGNAPKTPSDKPTLVAKPAPPAPLKSPWAALPPVDKVAPVTINPIPQSSTPKAQQSGIITQSPAPSPAVATMEIAADSFTRTPRENQNGAQGQLFNSQSGQYEPVNSGRRGSVRRDQNFRPPAVLQRPSQIEQRPVDTSAIPQSQRAGSQQEDNRWDRRASSTISSGSGLQGRRASLSQGHGDGNQQRSDAQPLQSPLTPNHAVDGAIQPFLDHSVQPSAPSKVQQLNDNSSATPSPQQGRGQLTEAGTTSHVSTDLDAEKERQKKLMKEKRELAIKRKKEEEEREEAAKKERIRIKMEQLGLPPLEKQGAERKANEVKQVVKRDVPQEAQSDKQPQEQIMNTVQPSPKPPATETSHGPRQYGVMTIHGPPATNGIASDHEPKESKSTIAPDQRTDLLKREPSTRGNDRVESPMMNGKVDKPSSGPSVPGSPELREQHRLQPQRQRPWNNVPRDSNAYPTWNGSGMTTHSAPTGSLWASNHKSLGNGVFDGNVSRTSSQHPPYQDHHPHPTPQPIGPPRSSQRPRESPESGLAPPTKMPPSTENLQVGPSYPFQDGTPAPFARTEASDLGQRRMASSGPALPNPSEPQISPERLPTDIRQQRSSLAAWSNFQSTSAMEDAEKQRQAELEHAARIAEEKRTGIKYEPQLPLLNETWRQVKVDDEAGQRRVVGVAKGVNAPEVSASHPLDIDIRMPPFASQPHPFHTASAGRGSRFFPTGGQGYQNQRAATYTLGYNRSPSPPPPDSAQHPAYARSQHHPLVNLPITKPKPTVRLPPALTPAPATPAADVQIAPLRAVSQPLVQNPSWQDRFNGLLGVKKAFVSPEKKFVEIAGFSETKLPLELPLVQITAAVSLPLERLNMAQVEGKRAVDSIPVDDQEALFEEREFGSLPTILLPTAIPRVKSQKNRKGFPKAIREPRSAEDIVSKGAFQFSLEDKEHDDPNGFAIFINLKGLPFPKKKIMPRSNIGINAQNTRGQRQFSGPNKSGRGTKPAPGHLSNHRPGQNGLPKPPMQNSPSQQHRGAWGKPWAKVSTAG